MRGSVVCCSAIGATYIERIHSFLSFFVQFCCVLNDYRIVWIAYSKLVLKINRLKSLKNVISPSPNADKELEWHRLPECAENSYVSQIYVRLVCN